MKCKHIYFIGLAFVSVLWGLNFGISRWAMDDFSAEMFIFLRFGLSVPMLFVILKWTEGNIGVEKRDLFLFAIIGLVGVTGLEVVMMYSIKWTTLANASLLNVAPWPIFVALFAPLFTQERMTLRIFTGGVLALIGVCMIFLGGESTLDLDSKYLIGNIIALSVSLVGALFNLSIMPLMNKYSPLKVTTWYILFGSLFLFPFTWKDWGQVPWSDLTMFSWGAIAYNVLLCTTAAFIIWNTSMKKVGATPSNFYRYITPAAATLTGAMFFNETIWLLQIAGGLLIVVALAWISMDRKKERQNTINLSK